jgi:hypothetical protein
MPGVEIGWQTQITTESRPWAIDLSPEMDLSDVIGSATATLTDLLTGLAYPTGLVGSPTVSGSTVTQVVASLVAGHTYRLVITAAMGGSKQTATSLLLNCPY